MAKKILVLSSSARKGGNSDLLCDEFIRGAQESGNEVIKMQISNLVIKDCLGCDGCRRNGGKCVQDDDMGEINEIILASDVIVMGSPVYFYTFNAQMKAVIDRTYAIVSKLQDKTFCLIAACAAPEKSYSTTMIDCFRKYIGCFKNCKEGGIVFGYGTIKRGDVKDTPAMEEAYQMGKNI